MILQSNKPNVFLHNVGYNKYNTVVTVTTNLSLVVVSFRSLRLSKKDFCLILPYKYQMPKEKIAMKNGMAAKNCCLE